MLVSIPSSISVIDPLGADIVVSIKPSSRSTRMRLICSTSGARLVVPSGALPHEIDKFMAHRKEWLLKTSRYYQKMLEQCGPCESDAIYFHGTKYRFNIVKDIQEFVTVSESMKLITFHVRDLRNAKKSMMRWFKSETTRIVNARVPEIAAKYGLAYNRISVKNLRSRWGSCSKKKNLNFSLLLSATPPSVAEYVIIHELMHLLRLDHSKEFWKLVESADPKYKEHRTWLTDNAPVIKLG